MKKIISAIVSIFIGLAVFAQDIPARPNPPVLVNDFANVFSKNEEARLEQKLVNFFASTSNQITVVTVKDLQGYDVQQYAYKIGEEWGVGGSEFNNGVVILFKPKTATSSGQVNISTGYGLEGAIPDATANQIIDYEMIPAFKQGDIYGGIDAATTVLMGLAKGEYNYQQYAESRGSSARGGFNPFILFILIFVVFPAIFGRRRRSFAGMGHRSSLPFWLGMGMMSGSHRSHGGMFNDFNSGSGSFGGGSSFGGFGGFGGGSFGGGGASGSW